MLARTQRGCPPWPGTTEISRACLHTAVSSQAPPEQAQSPRSLPACAHSQELLYKHRVHSWNRKGLRRVRAEADSLRKQKHTQIQPSSSGARQAKLPLKSQRNRYQDVKQHYQCSRLPVSPGHFSSRSRTPSRNLAK